ncbi:nitrilase-related carbon-nitrogen hydrolase [Paraferrimonas sp. SM1919]|uniref:nitrilase-related carbon-nitrogen hydrolase n=1 Tax=Paraferrimonas sp. SM1919 TaxID=2662263 RepID=UPI0013D68125|nr:nitrilase-related carbon-nitrogen hydrolase [Paraferrimonas sp. SM1919]
MTTRVAALQFKTGLDLAENLATCLKMIDEAAKCSPQLMLLPEFCNALSWYQDQHHAFELALTLDSDFLSQIASKAKQHNCHIIVNVTLRRSETDINAISVSSCLFDANGELVHIADKQSLMGHENDFFIKAKYPAKVAETQLGKLGIFPCRDGVTFEVAKILGLQGAQLLCDSLNSFAFDEASLHVPARAIENGIPLISSNKVGPLIPEELLDEVSKATGIAKNLLYGAGESQIIDGNGQVLAKASKDKQQYIYADIELGNFKTQLQQLRRPQIYNSLSCAYAPKDQPQALAAEVVLWTPDSSANSYNELVNFIEENSFDILVLPSNVFGQLSRSQIDRLVDRILPQQYLCFSTSAEHGELGLLISGSGVLIRQRPLHEDYQSQTCQLLADKVEYYDSKFGRLGILLSSDWRHPEAAKLAALAGVDLILSPAAVKEPWLNSHGFASRAAENRVAIAVCSDPNTDLAGGVYYLQSDFTLLSQWQQRQYDGYINQPIIVLQKPNQLLKQEINLANSRNKLMSANTHLLADRPWDRSALLSQINSGVSE